MVDWNLSLPRKKMKDLLDKTGQPLVIREIRGRRFVKVNIPPCGIVILKTIES